MTDLSIGDYDQPQLDVYPYQVGVTAATLTVYAPDGTSAVVPVDGGQQVTVDGQQVLRFTADPLQYTASGWWVRHWDVTGVGAGSEDDRVFAAAAPLPGGPAWLPAPARVAAYVPWLTVSTVVPGSQRFEGTFTDDTSPPTSVALQHIADAANVVTSLTSTLPAALYDLAGTVTALYAAASLAAAYARTGEDAERAAALLTRATAAYTQLSTSIDDLADGADDGQNAVLPVWSFPAPQLNLDYI